MPRTIEKINVINLKRRQDKLIGYYAMMQAWGTPPEMICPFEAYDAIDYLDSFEIRDAGIKQFPYWRKLDEDWLRRWPKGNFCCMWSMQSVLSKIAEGRDNSKYELMTTDHYGLRIMFEDLLFCVKQIPDFDLFQIWHWASPKWQDRLPEGFPRPLKENPKISHGLAGPGDTFLLMNPRGAQLLLDWWSEAPFHLLEVLIHNNSLLEPSNCVASINPWDFCWGPLKLEHLTGLVESERETNR